MSIKSIADIKKIEKMQNFFFIKFGQTESEIQMILFY